MILLAGLPCNFLRNQVNAYGWLAAPSRDEGVVGCSSVIRWSQSDSSIPSTKLEQEGHKLGLRESVWDIGSPQQMHVLGVIRSHWQVISRSIPRQCQAQ